MIFNKQLTLKPLYQQGLFILLITFTFCWLSLPGLTGGFILDDLPNLDNLGQIENFQSFFHYILNGNSSLLGRPISLLSFALQAEYWPNNPLPFKLAGLCIHIVNAWLVYVCCYIITEIKAWPERSRFLFAGSVFSLWLLLPLNISTVFYVVQRMTLLSAFFSLVGVAAFLWSFKLTQLNENSKKKALLIASAGMACTYILGILAKENAILTGLGITVLYFCLLKPHQRFYNWTYWILIFGALPSILLLTYLCLHLDQHSRVDFTPSQRLITESVILLDYLDKILLPTPFKLNIFNDGFPLYKEIVGSFEVLKAISMWIFLIISAVFLRKRLPFFTFAIFWFLSGHLLESTVFGLELYFEHRNYLPSLGLIIGIVGTLIDLNQKASHSSVNIQKISKYVGICLISTLSIIYLMVYGAEITAWKNPGAQAISAITERPNSLRAHQEAASFFANQGDFKSAEFLLDKVEQRWPSTGNYAQHLLLKCLDKNTNIRDQTALINRFEKGSFDRGTLSAMTDVYSQKQQGNCNFLSWDDYIKYVGLLSENPSFVSQLDDFLILQAYAYSALNKPDKAAEALNRFPDEIADTDYLLYKAQFFAMADNVDKALSIIHYIKNKFGKTIKYQLANQKNVDSLENVFKKSLIKQKNKN